MSAARGHVALAALVLISLALRLVSAAWLQPFQDEALYWWQAHEAWSFTPQPPFCMAAVRLGEVWFGRDVLALRWAGVVCGSLAIVLVFALGRALFDRRVGLFAAAATAATPVVVAVGAVSGPDAPLLCAWCGFVLASWTAVRTGRLRWWLVSGVVLGVGGYAKYVMALAVPSLGLALCLTPGGRRALRSPGPWCACALAGALVLATFVPWNLAHDWAPLRYHLSARHEWTVEADLLADYLGGHLAAISPLLWAAVVVACVATWRDWRATGDERLAWLLSFTVAPILFFVAPSAFTERELTRAHWDLVGYVTGFVLVARCTLARAQSGPWTRRLGRWGLATAAGMSVAVTLLGVVPRWAGALGVSPPSTKTLGWQELAERIRRLEVELPDAERPPYILANGFDVALCLGWALDRRADIYTIRGRHDASYGLTGVLETWGLHEQAFHEEHPQADALYVHRFRKAGPPREEDLLGKVGWHFRAFDLLDTLVIRAGDEPVRRFAIYRASRKRDWPTVRDRYINKTTR